MHTARCNRRCSGGQQNKAKQICSQGQPTNRQKRCMRDPGIEPGSVPWQGTILPLNQPRLNRCDRRHFCCIITRAECHYTIFTLVLYLPGRNLAASTISMKPSPGWKGSEAGTPLFTLAQAAVGTPGMSSTGLGLSTGKGLMPVIPVGAESKEPLR